MKGDRVFRFGREACANQGESPETIPKLLYHELEESHQSKSPNQPRLKPFFSSCGHWVWVVHWGSAVHVVPAPSRALLCAMPMVARAGRWNDWLFSHLIDDASRAVSKLLQGYLSGNWMFCVSFVVSILLCRGKWVPTERVLLGGSLSLPTTFCPSLSQPIWTFCPFCTAVLKS